LNEAFFNGDVRVAKRPSGRPDRVSRGPLRVVPDPAHSAVETRYLGIGTRAAGRHVLVTFTYRSVGEQRLIRPISARFMHAKEIEHYEAQS
jgi:uncharacterized DUF497 family protein